MSKLEKGDLCVVAYLDEHEEIWEVVNKIQDKDGSTVYQVYSAILDSELWEEADDLILIVKASGAQQYLNHYYNEVLPYKKSLNKKNTSYALGVDLTSEIQKKQQIKTEAKKKKAKNTTLKIVYPNTVDGQLDKLNDLYSKISPHSESDERFIDLANEIEKTEIKITKLNKLV